MKKKRYLTMSKVTINENFGSQMSNIAGLYSVAKRTGHRIIFLDSWTMGHGLKLTIPFQGLPLDVLSPSELTPVDQLANPYWINNKIIVDSQVYTLDSNLNWDIAGYFTSYRYWYPIRNDIFEMYTFNESIRKNANTMIQSISVPGKEIVAVHVRRTDYLTATIVDPTIDGYCLLNKDYYDRAFSFFPGDKYIFLIFSDDIPWCKSTFGERQNILYSDQKSPYIDMCAMSLCHHNIIANSSFSFWGALLNRRVDAKVICPFRYLAFDARLPHCNYGWFPDTWTPIVN